MDGILVINKPKGMTSREVVNQVSHLLYTKKIGHTGTLDPLATGVLVLAMGAATKIIELLTNDDKEYIAEFQIGKATDTLDITGKVLEEREVVAEDGERLKNVISTFERSYEQEVPLYSAVKVNGQRLYQYARTNREVSLPKRKVELKKLELLEAHFPFYTLFCKVSKGTYIRSLIRDIGFKADLPCTMTNLKRVKQGIFTIEESFTLEEIEKGSYQIKPIKEALENLPQIKVDDDLARKIKNGVKLPALFSEDKGLLLDQEDHLLAIYEQDSKVPNQIRAFRVF